jgi:hypothetical protein
MVGIGSIIAERGVQAGQQVPAAVVTGDLRACTHRHHLIGPFTLSVGMISTFEQRVVREVAGAPMRVRDQNITRFEFPPCSTIDDCHGVTDTKHYRYRSRSLQRCMGSRSSNGNDDVRTSIL